MSGRWWAERLSVVIPTFNRGDLLRRVLAAFAAQSLPPDRFEVLVVDDGSTDDTPARLAAYQATAPYPLTVLRQPNQGPAAARNTGLAAARGEVVVFIDDDCIPEPTLLAEHRASHEVAGLAVIGRIAWHPDLLVTPFMAYLERSVFGYGHIRVPSDAPFICYYTGNASVHRASAQAIGGFDTDFPRAMHEDIDFAYRLRGHGVRFVFNPAAVVGHYRAEGLARFLRNQYEKGREMTRFLAKHPALHAYTPLTYLGDPKWLAGCYRALLDEALVAGLAEGQARQPSDPWPADIPGDDRWTTDARLEQLWAVARDLRRDLAVVERQQRWAEVAERDHARLAADFAAQAARAADLARQVEQRRPVLRLLDAAVRAVRPRPPAPPSWLALLAQRRAGQGPVHRGGTEDAETIDVAAQAVSLP